MHVLLPAVFQIDTGGIARSRAAGQRHPAALFHRHPRAAIENHDRGDPDHHVRGRVEPVPMAAPDDHAGKPLYHRDRHQADLSGVDGGRRAAAVPESICIDHSGYVAAGGGGGRVPALVRQRSGGKREIDGDGNAFGHS